MGIRWIGQRAGEDSLVIATSFVRLVSLGVAGTPLHFERRKAVESSFRGFPPPITDAIHSVRTFDTCSIPMRLQGCKPTSFRRKPISVQLKSGLNHFKLLYSTDSSFFGC